MRPPAGAALLVLVLTAVLPLGAQFRSGVNVVEVYATVVDAKGTPVAGLTRGDFELREDGVVQEISTFAEGRFPLAVALAVDRSFSMAGGRLEVARSAAREFLGSLRPDDESMLIGVGSRVEVLAPLSRDRAAQYAALASLDPFGTTGLHDAVIAAMEAVGTAPGRRALVLLSDGDDRYSRATAADALARARASDVLVYPVALGRTRPPLFAELATLTGGRSHHVRDPRRLPQTLREITSELRQQYLIGYSPAKPIAESAGEWRAIGVTVPERGVTVRARDGYIAR